MARLDDRLDSGGVSPYDMGRATVEERNGIWVVVNDAQLVIYESETGEGEARAWLERRRSLTS